MGALNIYLNKDLEEALRREAAATGRSVSSIVSETLAEKFEPKSQWPKNFFGEVFGGWKGDFPEREDTSILDLPDVKFD